MSNEEYERINRKLELKFLPAVQRALQAPRREVLAQLRAGGTDAAIRYLHTVLSNAKLAAVIRNLYITVAGVHARANYSRQLREIQTKAFGDSSAWQEIVLRYLERFLTEKITYDVSNTTRDRLLKAINKGIEEGNPIQQIVSDIEGFDFERFQAARIVRTETNRAANVGAKAMAQTSKYEQTKTWSSAKDWRVRGNFRGDHANHVLLNGVTIDADMKFLDIRSGDELDVPGDPTASAATTINCRCHVTYKMKRDENGDPIPKRTSVYTQLPGQNPNRRTVTIGGRPRVSVTRPRTTNLPTVTI